MTQLSSAPVTRPIHPVQPTFGLRVKQQLAGNAPTGPRADQSRQGEGIPGKIKREPGNRRGGPGNERGRKKGNGQSS